MGVLSGGVFVMWGFCRVGFLSCGGFVGWGFCRVRVLSVPQASTPVPRHPEPEGD